MPGSDKFDKHFQRKREGEVRVKKTLSCYDDEPLPPPVEPIKKKDEAPGRNDPCPCGSGRKFKQCCINKKKK